MAHIPTAGGREPARFYPPRWKLLLLAAASALFTGIGYVISMSQFPVLSWIGWAMAAVFAAGTVVMVVKALRPGPTVIFDDDGITDRTSLVPTGLVRWEEITVVRKREIGRGRGSERLLDVVLTDPDTFFARERSTAGRLSDHLRRKLRNPDVGIPGSMVSKPMRVIIAELNRWRPHLQVLELPPPPPPRFSMFRRQHQPRKRHPEPPRW